MATVTISKRSDGVVNSATASWTGDGAAQTVTPGFVPLYVEIINATDSILWKKFDPMVAANSIKIDSAVAIDTGSMIVINSTGTLTLHATLSANAKALKLYARR